MKSYKPENPIFSESITITEPTDRAHADNVNAAPKQLIANDLALKALLEKLRTDAGDVMIGPEGTELKNNDTLFVTDEPPLFRNAVYTNMQFGEEVPSGGENWAKLQAGETLQSAENINKLPPGTIVGELEVSDTADPSKTFFADTKNTEA